MLTHNCHLCHSTNLELTIDLGHHPLADTFIPAELLNEPETRYPLRTLLCRDCGHMMLQYVVSPEERYQKVDYSYTSSNSAVAIKHFGEMANEIIRTAKIGAGDLVVDIGSSDGTLLKAFRDQSGCRVVGVEPAPNIAKMANDSGVETINDFFGKDATKKILEKGKVKAITANNVFNHITDLSDFMTNIVDVLTDDGFFVFEAPSLIQLVERLAFDTIYLEHVSYFGIKPLHRFFKQFGLSIHRIDLNDYMGGSMRVYVGKQPADEHIATALIEKEEAAGIYASETYVRFMTSVRDFKMNLCRQLYDIKANGGKIVGIGAATKGNTLLNYCGIDGTLLEYVTDSSPLKIGKYTPGSHLPIIADADIPKDATHALILPWNIGTFLKEKLKHLPLEFLVPQMKKDL
ncbi:MAG: class I SAM-dependent methyltransferase [Patescibacteria group bacterium]|jgi:SAM-dependent methyltransferase